MTSVNYKTRGGKKALSARRGASASFQFFWAAGEVDLAGDALEPH